jgi:hypothetical protein
MRRAGHWAASATPVSEGKDEVARRACKALEVEIARTGQSDLQRVLDWAHKNLADLL